MTNDEQPLTQRQLKDLANAVQSICNAMYELQLCVETQGSGMSYEFCHGYPFKWSFDEVLFDVLTWQGMLEDKANSESVGVVQN